MDSHFPPDTTPRLADAQPRNPEESDPLLAPLNPEQRAAAIHVDGPLLILAGAGSGKTRAITHRIAWLVERQGVAPWRILAVTFTNKAAAEMRERLVKLLGPAAGSAQVATFHATGAAILRREAELVGLSRSFVIYDDSDQLQLIRRALHDCGVGDQIKAQLVRHRIDHAKNHAQGPDDMPVPPSDVIGQRVKKAYRVYQQLLAKADAVDFGDLLLKVVELFRRDQETLARYRRRFQYVLVDEFQDTNPIQYEFLRLLCPREHANLCVVGDDDQSIYRWRGADVTNILSFEHDFAGAQVVKLERNYRSDAGILEAAYAVISKNSRRKEKRLWTDRPRGMPLNLMLAADERDEAQQVASAIRQLGAEGVPYSEIAVFFRVNAQSRVLEQGMRLAGIAYQVVRARAFYDRAEIKDAASYLRLAINPNSDADLERVINSPPRGIGQTTIDRLRAHAQERQLSLAGALAQCEQISTLNASAQRRLRAFGDLMHELHRQVAKADDARQAVERMLELSGLIRSFAAIGDDESSERLENLQEFVSAAAEFDRIRAQDTQAASITPQPGEGKGSEVSLEQGALKLPQSALEAFLEQISLVGDADSNAQAGRVSLMTLHAAKGLEFDAVFMTGMEENVFPHARAQSENGMGEQEEMAEERRLCYVGITRARSRLCLSLARTRALFGDFKRNPPSRFLSDIPKELFGFDTRSPTATIAREPSASRRPVRLPGETYVEREPEIALEDIDGFGEYELDQRPAHERQKRAHVEGEHRPKPSRAAAKKIPLIGSRVFHAKFGEGLVVSGPTGMNHTMGVRFPEVGEKRITAQFLTMIDD